MELLKIILVSIYTMFLYYRTGILFKKTIKSNNKCISSSIIYGFILNIAIFELINIPFIVFARNNTSIVYVIYLILNVAYIVLSYAFRWKNKEYNLIENIKQIHIGKNIQTLAFVMAIIVICFQIFNSTFSFKQDADDAFYISWANEAKELELMYDTNPAVGTENSEFDNKYILNTWEIYGGFLARMFNIDTVVLFHTAYQIIYITLAYISYYLVLKTLLKKENIGIAILIFSILMMFSAVSARFKGALLLGRIHQGKSILLNIIIPFVIYKFSNYKNSNNEDFIILSFAYIAAVGCNPITVWLLSIIYGLYMIIMLINKDLKNFFKSMSLLVIIFIVCMLFIMLALTNRTELQTITKAEEFNQLQDLKNFVGKGKYIIVLYIISMLIVFIKGNEKQKNLCVYLPILIFVLVINPILKDIYVKVVTAATYWRLYWTIPIEISIGIATMLIYDNINISKYKYTYIIIMILLFIISGKYMYTPEMGFSKFENFEKIPQYIIDEAHYIVSNSNEKVKVITPNEPWHSCMIRQYTTQIQLGHTRNVIYESDTQYRDLYLSIYAGADSIYNTEAINEIIDKYNADYVILPISKQLEIDNTCNFTLEIQSEANYILKTKK